ncbi:MAG: hypothetical protein PHW90_02590 [Bacilli bacterium]|nr:hypothetical protein [Bacilli bacterium]
MKLKLVESLYDIELTPTEIKENLLPESFDILEANDKYNKLTLGDILSICDELFDNVEPEDLQKVKTLIKDVVLDQLGIFNIKESYEDTINLNGKLVQKFIIKTLARALDAFRKNEPFKNYGDPSAESIETVNNKINQKLNIDSSEQRIEQLRAKFETKFKEAAKSFADWCAKSTKVVKNNKKIYVTLEWLMASIESINAKYPDTIQNLDQWLDKLSNAYVSREDFAKIKNAGIKTWGFAITASLNVKALHKLEKDALDNPIAESVYKDIKTATTVKNVATASPSVLINNKLTGSEWVISLIEYLNDLDDKRYIGIGDNENKNLDFNFAQYD